MIYISTTELANHVKMKRNPFFNLLSEWNWIAKESGQWVLLPDGERVGGIYRENKYGKSIVWPDTLIEMECFKHIENEYIDDYYDHQMSKVAAKKAGRVWTVEQDQALLEAVREGRAVEELAVEYDRSIGSINSRIRKLKI